MNRHSCALGAKQHEFVLGLYDVLRRIFEPRPEILLESCSSGGNRFDCGMLFFSPQIWCSDNTDPVERLRIQQSLSYLYPPSCFGTHVSASPHAQTLRATPLSTRGNISMFGCLGYELDLTELLPVELTEIRAQIEFYKAHRRTLQYGRFTRDKTDSGGTIWQAQTEEETVAGVFHGIQSAAPGYERLRVAGLDAQTQYQLDSRPQLLRVGDFGSLLRHVLPVKLNPNGLAVQTADSYYKMYDGQQTVTASGAAYSAGIMLAPRFSGTGYNADGRMQGDFGSNVYFFGLGTIGRDMFYAFEANALLYFLSNILSLPIHVFAAVSLVLSVLRIADALNDPITGLVIDNIHTKWGKFKPAILVGGVVSVIFYLILFGNVGTGTAYVIFFAVAYVLWDISYGINDIAYWTLLPALTQDQKQRENYGAFARICANIGMYIIMVGWQPITAALGNTTKAWMTVAVAVSIVYLAGLCFPLIGVKENREIKEDEEKFSIRDMWNAITKNDQLMWTTLAMALFMVGYCTTTGFATYYMQYLYGDINMYAILAAVCGVAQLAALMIFPLFSKKHDRRQLYTGATVLVVAGYLAFFFAEHSIVLIAISAILMFVGQAFIQLLMLMFLADTIEYGQWKLGRRSESITFSIQPLVNKIGGALSTGLISISIMLAGIKTKGSDTAAAAIDASGKLTIKLAMLAIPLVLIVAGYVIYLRKYKISKEFYDSMLADIKSREAEASADR